MGNGGGHRRGDLPAFRDAGTGDSARRPADAVPPARRLVFQNDGGVLIHSTRQVLLPAFTSLCGAVGRK